MKMIKINKEKLSGNGNKVECEENGYLWKVDEIKQGRGYSEYWAVSVATGVEYIWFSDEPEVEVVELDDGEDG